MKHLMRPAAMLLTMSLVALSAARATAADIVTLATVGAGSALDWPLYIAIKQGFTAAQNISIDFITTPSSAAVQQQVASGSVNIGEGGLPDAFRAIDKGAPVSILRIQAQSAPYALLSKPTITSYAMLKGKLISIGGAKDITRTYVERMLAANGVRPGEYDSVYAGATSARFAALQSGAVDAAILTSPFNFKAESLGLHSLGLTVSYVNDFPFTCYTVNKAWATKNKDVVARFGKAIASGVDWFLDSANKAEAVKILIEATKSLPDDADKTWSFYHEINIYDRDGVPSRAGLEALIKILRDNGDVEGDPSVSRFYDPVLVAR